MDQSGPGFGDRSASQARHGDFSPGVTRNEYDALADLFLGDAAFAPNPNPTPNPTPNPAPSSSTPPTARSPVQVHAASTPPSVVPPALHLTGQPAVYPESRGDTSSPNVWRLVGDPGNLDAAAAAASAAPSAFGSAAGFDSASRSLPREITIEAIVQGHLPIFASAWVPQYARSLSQEMGAPVALIRVRHGQISVERFAADIHPSSPLPKHATLAEAVESAHAPRVLVQVDEIAEPDLWRTPGLDRITVLTGADEAAMVACYRTLKTIGQELAHDLSPDHVEDAGTPARPALAVAVLGATPERAQQTISRIQRAASNFLSRQVQGHHAAGRIGAGQSETLFRGVALDGDSSPVALIALIRAASDIAAEQAPATAFPPPHLAHPMANPMAQPMAHPMAEPNFTEPTNPVAAPRASDRAPRTSAWDRVAARLEEKFGPSTAAAIPHVEPKPLHPIPAQPAATTDSIEPLDLVDLEPTTTSAQSPVDPVADAASPVDSSGYEHPHLATFVDELLAIDEQCPYADAAEFAIAADGRLHILVHTGIHTHNGHPGGQGRALEELTTAATWAMAHTRLFTRTHRGLKLDDTEHRPILHLVTDRPREARRLLETDIRIHLVAPVDPQARYICRDLN
jgi:hypothetical protein